MTRTLKTAELVVSKPYSTAPVGDFAVPRAHIQRVEWAERAGRPLDTGTITLDNADGRYSRADSEFHIDVDDKLYFRVSWEGDGVGAGFGDQPFGHGTFGGDPKRQVGTLAVADWTATGQQWNSELELDVETFVFNRLNEKTAHQKFDDAPLSGTKEAILNTCLREHTPRVDRSLLPDIPETTDYFVDGKFMSKVVDEIATLARVVTGDAYVVGTRDEALLFAPLADIEPVGTFTSDRGGDLEGTPQHASAAEAMANEIRVEGGIDDELNIDEEQKTDDQWTTVTSTNRVTYQLQPSKPELTRVHCQVQHVTGSEDNLRVRLHPDQAGSPRDLSNGDLDYATGRIELEEGEEGERRVRLGEHILGPQDTPWLVFEASGSDGVNIRTDSTTGDPWFETHFSKPVIVEVPDQESQNQYLEHEATVQNEALETFDAARDRAEAELARRGVPRQRFGPMDAESERAHELRVGDAVTLPFDWLGADGDYLCTQVSHTYDGGPNRLSTSLEFMGFERYA